jgi:hypothetical protein
MSLWDNLADMESYEQSEAGQNRLMFRSECMLARKLTSAPLCPGQ